MYAIEKLYLASGLACAACLGVLILVIRTRNMRSHALAADRFIDPSALAEVVDLHELVFHHAAAPTLLARVDPESDRALANLRRLVGRSRGSKVIVLASKLDADLVSMLDSARVHGIAAVQDTIEDLIKVVCAINAGEEAVLSPAARLALRR